jgi:S1-C subfamily serine protease
MSGNPMSRRPLLAAALVALVVGALPAHADFAQAADKVRDAVVTVMLEKRMGTGFVVSGEGYILTNRHVMGQATKATVRLANKDELPAQLVKADATRDLMVLKVERAHLPAVTFASSAKLKQGTEVAALGAPLGLPDSLTKGIVSSTSRDLDGQKFMQIDAALNHGNSGGPIIIEAGQVVGVATLVAKKAENLGFAIPSDEVMAFLDKAGVTYTTLDAPAPADAAAAPEGAPDGAPEAAPGTPAVPGAPAAPPDAPAAPPPAPGSLLARPWVGLAAAALIAFLVSLITALVVARSLLRGLPTPVVYSAPPAYPPPGWGGAQPAAPLAQPPQQPAPPPADDLSDIDIQLR